MKTLVRDTRLSGLRWLTLRGAREEVFSDLGQLCRREIQDVQTAMPEREGLRTWRDSPAGKRRYQYLLATAEQDYPDVLQELNALADGAGLDREDLFLANIRGDIGSHDGTGCTDLIWRRGKSFVAHNEDGAPAVGADLMFLSLDIDGDQPVTAQWYPGFIPSNAFAATAGKLVWGINHLPISSPGNGAGRHFVARRLQRTQSLEEAIEFLQTHPMAGGFSFNIGELETGKVATVESAAGQVAIHHPSVDDPFAWHTNHLRMLPEDLQSDLHEESPHGTTAQLGQSRESIARGEFLSSLQPPSEEPCNQWFLDILTAHELPRGVLRTARDDDPLATLCTTVTDLTTGTVLVKGPGFQPESITVTDLIAG